MPGISIPAVFESNLGQASADYRFIARHTDGDVRFTNAGPDFFMQGRTDRAVIQLRPIETTASMRAEGKQPLQASSNYLIGRDPSHWITNVSTFGEVSYSEIYPGVELLFYGSKDHLEHDFVVSPRAEPTGIRFILKGADRVVLSDSGDIVAYAAGEHMVLHKPVAYQDINGKRVKVESAFHLDSYPSASGPVISFELGQYDSSEKLTIDPVLTFSTYLGGTHADIPATIATDSSGNIYVAGNTRSSDYPTASPYRSSCSTCTDSTFNSDAYISKLDPTGHTLLYSTYFGGQGEDEIDALAIDSSNNVVVTGYTNSTDFPSAGSFRSSVSSGVFAVSIMPDGSHLKFSEIVGDANSTYGADYEHRFALALDSLNNVFIAGLITANNGRSPNFPITVGTYGSGATNFGQALFALKLAADGEQVYGTVIPPLPSTDSGYSTYLGGIALSPQGDLYIAGTTSANLPTTAGALTPTFPNAYPFSGGYAGFLLSLNPTASALNFATYLPGTDGSGAVLRASDGSLYITGPTSESNLPVSPTAFQKALSEGCRCNNGYILRINDSGSAVLRATYLSGSIPYNNMATSYGSIASDSGGNIFVGGNTSSDDFPVVNPIASFSDQTGNLTGVGTVIAGLSPDLSSMVFGSYYNGEGAGSQLRAMTVSAADRVVFAGITFSNSNFITTADAYQPKAPASPSPFTGYLHQYVASIDLTVPAPSVCFDKRFVNFVSVAANSTSYADVLITNCGNAPLTIQSLTPSSSLVAVSQPCWTIAAGNSCTLQLAFTPASSAVTTGTVAIVANSVISKHTLKFYGQGIAPNLSTSSSLSFGQLLVGSATPRTGTIIVQNTGNATLTFSGASVTGDFSLTSNSCISPLAPSNSRICVIGLSFMPTAAGPRTGSLVISSNDPVAPQTTIALTGTGLTAYTVPLLTALSKPTQAISSSSVDITLYGSDFFPQSTVRVNGQPVATTFASGGILKATIPPSLLSAIGELSLTVYNPTPGGGESLRQVLTLYQSLTLTPSFLVSVPSTGMLYAAIPNSTVVNPNTVVPIDAASGQTGTPIPVGRNPVMLAATGDGKYLYVALQDDQAVQRIDLQTQTVDRTFPFPANICTTCGPSTPVDLQAVPANSKQVVLSLGNMLALYNDTGLVNSVPGSYVYTFTPIFNSITFAGASEKIYSLPFTTVQNSYFGSVTMDATGLQYPPVTGTNYGGDNTTGGQVVSDGTLLYTSAGQVWDPSKASKVGTFPVTTYNSTSYPNERNLTFDGGLGELYVIGYQAYGSSSSANVLTAYSQNSLAITGTLAFPDIQSVILSNLVRWGADGFAFVGSGNVYVVRSNAVSPSSVNPSPGLSSISPVSANAGDAGFTLTLNGSNFTPASVANWNQMPLPTTYVSGTQLTVTVPASNIATAGTAQITVSPPGPGGGISSAQPFSITGPPTITFNIDNHTFGDAPFEVSASSNSPGAISYSVLSGPATLSGSTLTITGAGTISVKADQMAAGSYSASSQNTSFTAGKAAGMMAIASSANPVLLQNAVTITASVASTATGTVVFTEGSSNLATVGLTNGVAAFTTSTLPTGSHTISATYSGDANFSGSTKTVTQVVQELALAVAPNGGSSQTVQRGSSAVYKLLLNPSGTPLPGTVTLAVSGLPAGATAAFSPSSVAAGAGATPVTLTVQVPVNLAGLDKHMWGDAASLSLALILIPVARRRSPLGRLVLFVCLGLVSSTLVACGGSSSSSSSQSSSKTYILTVTAGPNIQSTTLTMIVQ